jgi:hypothetical protein
MLTIEKTVLPSPEQWEIIIEGMRNPMNSWDMSDSYKTHIEDHETLETADFEFFLGDKDHDLMSRLAKGGPVHGKYRRMIPVFLTINAPLYWWKEFDTYKVGTVCNSCSTMHKIHSKEFTLDDFSHEHLFDCEAENIPEEDLFYLYEDNEFYYFADSDEVLDITIKALNLYRERFLTTKDKKYWWQLIQLLPSSYNQKRTVMLNYEVLTNIYHSRKNHKLDEWHTFCDWIRGLPYSELITGGDSYEA